MKSMVGSVFISCKIGTNSRTDGQGAHPTSISVDCIRDPKVKTRLILQDSVFQDQYFRINIPGIVFSAFLFPVVQFLIVARSLKALAWIEAGFEQQASVRLGMPPADDEPWFPGQ